ncbi:MAG: LTA synthase family protein [Nitrospiraceae bacterium]|nr:LTA synthase family protein [Nitrospiraceae bacterium]
MRNFMLNIQKNSIGRFRLLALYLAVFISFSFILRTTLIIKSWPMLHTGLLLKIYVTGLFYDVVTAMYAAVPMILYLAFAPDRALKSRLHKPAVYIAAFATLYIMMFDGFAEYIFFDEFSTRFNFIAVDYLVYTTEVIKNIRESYNLALIFGAIASLALILFLALRKSLDASLLFPETKLIQRLKVGLVILLIPALSVLLIDQSYTRVSHNTYANEIAANGMYNFFAAIKNNSLDFKTFYRSLDDKAALKLLKREINELSGRLVSNDPQDIRHRIAGKGPEKKLNVVVIMVESLSADFLGVFGNKENLTPNLDRIARNSLFFRQAYATGTRTDRGLEAVTLSIPPTPGRSIVKRPDNEDLFSWGQIMRSKGYDVKFIYGGNGYFDNMNYFFGHNGYATIDKKTMAKKDIRFENAWGVSDEDLFTKAIAELNKSHESGAPFFAHIMTTSNHRPFTYPEGRIDIPSKTGRKGAVKYTDYAIGKFISDAERQPWYADTIFVIVADHCASSAGKMSLPPDRYHIPLIVYSPAHITPRTFDTIVSQIDIAPTVLGMMNFRYISKFIGKDVFNVKQDQGEAFIGTYQKLGYIDDGMLVILDLKKQVEIRRLSDMSMVPVASPAGREVAEEAVAYYQSASYIFEHKLNRWDSPQIVMNKNNVNQITRK